MQNISVSLTVVVLLALIALLVATTAVPVESGGTLQSVNGSSPPGKITAIQAGPHLSFTSHEVKEDGLFRFTGDPMGPLVLHGRSMEHLPADRMAAGTTGIVTMSFTVPVGQDVQVWIVDAEGDAVAGARLRAHHGDFKHFIH